ERIAQPFRDAAGWFGGVLHAKSENKKLKRENEELRQQAIQNESALRENTQLKRLLDYLEGARFPRDYRGVSTSVIGRAPTQFAQQVVVSAGKNDGIAKHDA